MFIRAYLRASTKEQNAERAKEQLNDFVKDRGLKIASTYVENISGNKLQRPELSRLLSDAHNGDIILIEAVDRLTRLTTADWKELSDTIKAKGLKVVALDLPTSFQLLEATNADEFTGRILDAINNLLMDILAATANKDYIQRRVRQAQGIKANKDKFRGKQIDIKLHSNISALLQSGKSWAEVQDITSASRSTVARVAKSLRDNI